MAESASADALDIYPDFQLSFDFELTSEFEGIDPSIFDEDFCDEEKDKPVLQGRFKSLTEPELSALSDKRFSSATKKNSKWGFKVFNEWCLEKTIQVDLCQVSEDELANHLTKFYAEAQAKTGTDYHRNTVKNLRAALNRYIQIECGRSEINIVKDKAFKRCNDMLCAKLKNDCRQGVARPTQHKPVIPTEDMQDIFKYLKRNDPVTLRYKVWILLSLHYVSRGLEFHSQLSPNSFSFQIDESGSEYVTLTHSTQQKNHQGDLGSSEEFGDKRMYSNKGGSCPVQTLKAYLNKLDPKATSLFCHIKQEAMTSPDKLNSWYLPKPVRERQFRNFMPDICKHAGLERRYTAHSLRATALSAMTDNDIPVRHIMSLSDHSSESSLIPYARPSTTHKKQMSSTLSTLYSVEESTGEIAETQTYSASTSTCTSTSASTSTCTTNTINSQADMFNTMSGFITKSSCTFNNCSFSFVKQ